MTPKKNYSRYFIILQEDEKGYSLDTGKTPSGYAKLEMKNNKCKVSYYVQNLRKEKQPYHMVLICGKKDVNTIIKLGKLNIDDFGRVDIFNEYEIENIADTGISSDKIVGAAIVKFLDTNVVSIMSGFSTTDKPNEWKKYKLAESNSENKETRSEDLINEFDDYEENIELIKSKSDDKVVERTHLYVDQKDNVEVVENLENCGDAEKTEIYDRLNENMEDIEPEDGLDVNRDKHKKECKESKELKHFMDKECKELKHDMDKEYKEIKHDKDKDCECNSKEDKHGDYPKGVMGDFFKKVAKDFEEVPNFSKEIKWCKWYKVPINKLESMYDFSDYNKYTIAYYPMICYYPYIRNHKSYMLGYKCDSNGKMKYIVYGIPGSRAKAHQPYGGKTGFVTWISNSENDEMGHWLMFYDFKKSTIVVPVKK